MATMLPESGSAFSSDLDQAMGESTTVPPVQGGGTPTGYSVPGYSEFMGQFSSTLDEEVAVTLLRDVQRVADNIKLVLIPRQKNQQKAVLREWDLWGPFVFVLLLASILAAGHSKPSQMFSIVFTLLCVGAVVLTANVVLLGGKIIFFQSLSLIGYCLFPLDVAALLCLFWSNPFYRNIVLGAGVGWASFAAVPFISSTVSPARQALAVYPVFLLFITIAWLALVNG